MKRPVRTPAPALPSEGVPSTPRDTGAQATLGAILATGAPLGEALALVHAAHGGDSVRVLLQNASLAALTMDEVAALVATLSDVDPLLSKEALGCCMLARQQARSGGGATALQAWP